MEKPEFHVLIKYCFLMRKNRVQANQWLDKCYSDFALSETTVLKLYDDFKLGRADINLTERSVRPNSVVVPESTKKKKKKPPQTRFTWLQIVVASDSRGVEEIRKQWIYRLSMRKLCLKWVPNLLTVDQKQ